MCQVIAIFRAQEVVYAAEWLFGQRLRAQFLDMRTRMGFSEHEFGSDTAHELF